MLEGPSSALNDFQLGRITARSELPQILSRSRRRFFFSFSLGLVATPSSQASTLAIVIVCSSSGALTRIVNRVPDPSGISARTLRRNAPSPLRRLRRDSLGGLLGGRTAVVVREKPVKDFRCGHRSVWKGPPARRAAPSSTPAPGFAPYPLLWHSLLGLVALAGRAACDDARMSSRVLRLRPDVVNKVHALLKNCIGCGVVRDQVDVALGLSNQSKTLQLGTDAIEDKMRARRQAIHVIGMEHFAA
jgi:hypothetical protein